MTSFAERRSSDQRRFKRSPLILFADSAARRAIEGEDTVYLMRSEAWEMMRQHMVTGQITIPHLSKEQLDQLRFKPS